jgi:ribosomal protein S18 acetylase RimI-like enzyme
MAELPKALDPPDPHIRIRPVLLTDAEALHSNFWSDRPYTLVYQMIKRAQQIARQGRGMGVIMTGESPYLLRGFGQLTMWPRCAEISDLFIHPELRSRGLGTTLIQYLTRSAKEMSAPAVEIGVSRTNSAALALYERLGFKPDHEVMVGMGGEQELILYLRIDLP